MLVAAYDPSLTATGIVLLHGRDDPIVEEVFTIRPPAQLRLGDRLKALYEELMELVTQQKVRAQASVVEHADPIRFDWHRSRGSRGTFSAGDMVGCALAQGVVIGTLLSSTAVVGEVHPISTREWKGGRSKQYEGALARLQFPGAPLTNDHLRDAARLGAWWLARQGLLTR